MVRAGRLNHLSRFRFSTETLHITRKMIGSTLSASAPPISFDLMCEPGRLLCRSMYSFTTVRKSMNPSVTVRMKINVETAQNR